MNIDSGKFNILAAGFACTMIREEMKRYQEFAQNSHPMIERLYPDLPDKELRVEDKLRKEVLHIDLKLDYALTLTPATNPAPIEMAIRNLVGSLAHKQSARELGIGCWEFEDGFMAISVSWDA